MDEAPGRDWMTWRTGRHWGNDDDVAAPFYRTAHSTVSNRKSSQAAAGWWLLAAATSAIGVRKLLLDAPNLCPHQRNERWKSGFCGEVTRAAERFRRSSLGSQTLTLAPVPRPCAVRLLALGPMRRRRSLQAGIIDTPRADAKHCLPPCPFRLRRSTLRVRCNSLRPVSCWC